MLTILGPAKTIDTTAHEITGEFSLPDFPGQSEFLVRKIQKYSLKGLQELMKISPSLASRTVEEFAAWHRDPAPGAGIQAILAFSGEVFRGLQARSLDESDLLFAQENVRILSGLHGVLRPLDLIMPYRLEMGTKLSTRKGKTLYAYWKDIIPGRISADTASSGNGKVLINLASDEYFKAIHPSSFPHRIITPVFRESQGEGYRNVTVYAKKARGMMLRFIIENRIEDPDYLKAFDTEGYAFNEHLSQANEWVYIR